MRPKGRTIVSKRIISKVFKVQMVLLICPISSSAPRPPGAAQIPILLSEVEQEQKSSGNGDREAIVVGAGLCDGDGERACTEYAPTIEGEVHETFTEGKILFLNEMN